MANQKLNEVTTVPTASINNVKTFLAVMNDGSIQQMNKDDMATVLGGLLSNKLFLPYTLSSEYNENLDYMRGKNARTIINTSYDSSNPNSTPNPINQWAVVDTDYYPAGGYTRQILTSWFNPQNRMIRYNQDGIWSNWINL